MNDSERIIEKLIKETVETELGFELVGIEVKKGRTQLVRVFIDRPGGIDVEMCALVSRRIESIIGESEIISGFYNLEVSSPGIERPLMKPSDYVRFKGRKVLIKAKEPISGRRQFKGELVEATEEDCVVKVDMNSYRIKYGEISKAKLVFDFSNEEMKR